MSTKTLPLLVLVVAIVLLSALFLWLGIRSDRASDERDWLTTSSDIIDSRVMQDQLESISGVRIIYFGEYKLRYSVAGKEYEIWQDAEVTGDSRQEIALKLANGRPYAHYAIHYNPKHPSQVRAEIAP